MNKDLGTYIHSLIASSNYTILLVVICQILSITIILKYWRNEKAHKLMLLYTSYGLFLFTMGHFIFYLINQNNSNVNAVAINEILNIIYSVIEIACFTHILKTSINSKSIRIINRGITSFVTVITPVLLFIVFYDKVANNIKRYITDTFSFFGIAYIGILTLVYFINIFKSSPEIDLKKSPVFWISSFLLLYAIGFPLIILLIEYYRHTNREIFQVLVSLHYLSLSLVYIGIIKAVLCKKTLTS